MLEIAELGLPIAIEALDLISPQYLQDLVSWTAIAPDNGVAHPPQAGQRYLLGYRLQE